MSVRWQFYLANKDSIQMLVKSPDSLLGVVLQPTDSRLSETTTVLVFPLPSVHMSLLNPLFSGLVIIPIMFPKTSFSEAPINICQTSN